MNHYLSIDIGGTFIKYALMNEEGTILKQGKTNTIKDNKEKLYQSIIDIKNNFDESLQGLAVSSPGYF